MRLSGSRLPAARRATLTSLTEVLQLRRRGGVENVVQSGETVTADELVRQPLRAIDLVKELPGDLCL